MSRQPTRATGPELRLNRALRAEGWRYTTKTADLPGRPDVLLRDRPVVIFVDGCFWHGCPRCYRTPTNNAQWWEDKIATNRRRDARQSRQLRRMGYSVVRLREHETSEAWVRRLARVLNVCG